MAIVGAESEAVGSWPGWDTALPLLLPGHLPRRGGDCRGHGKAAAAPFLPQPGDVRLGRCEAERGNEPRFLAPGSPRLRLHSVRPRYALALPVAPSSGFSCE